MNGVKKVFLEWFFPVALAITIAILINKFLVFNIEVPTGSMKPTIEPGDKFVASRIYNFENIKRGDILIFDSNFENSVYIKRVIGLPKETVDIKSGKVFVDGKEIEEDYVKFQKETNEHFEVPEGSYLFLGDNRADSKDARYWDNPYIKKEAIKGKAQIRIYPFNKMGSIE